MMLIPIFANVEKYVQNIVNAYESHLLVIKCR